MSVVRPLILCCSLLFATSAAADASQQVSTPSAATELPSAGYIWSPQIAPQGPVVIIVSLPEQRAYVYRNGIRIGLSKVSTGKPGHETPTGVFEILQKRREHYSNFYNSAPMPFMQRLTWDGIALHAGNVPDNPASHGCIRLPYKFSQALFAVTSRGMTVIVSDKMGEPSITTPDLFAPSAASSELAGTYKIPAPAPYRWTPGLVESGPIAILLSTHDQEVRILRNAVEIGRAPIILTADPVSGTSVYVLLDGTAHGAGIDAVRPALPWQQVPLIDSREEAPRDVQKLVGPEQLRVDPEFVRLVYDALTPGATLLVTDEPLQPLVAGDISILSGDQPQPVSPYALGTGWLNEQPLLPCMRDADGQRARHQAR